MPIKLNISKDDCSNIAEILEIYFFQNIRDDVGIDNIEYVHNLIHAIEELRAADKDEAKYGHWYLLDECSNEGVYCSVCNKKVYKTFYANQKLKSKFCPNCGAKMGTEMRVL